MKNIDNITRQNEKIWDSRAGSYDKTLGILRWSQRKLVSLIDLKNGPVVLDLACGTGWGIRYMAVKADSRGQFYGIDISEKMIEQSEVNLRRLNTSISAKPMLKSCLLAMNSSTILFVLMLFIILPTLAGQSKKSIGS
jgi:ubiquinone/menaquinone biosynthesis C-methylase UbiE